MHTKPLHQQSKNQQNDLLNFQQYFAGIQHKLVPYQRKLLNVSGNCAEVKQFVLLNAFRLAKTSKICWLTAFLTVNQGVEYLKMIFSDFFFGILLEFLLLFFADVFRNYF